MNNKYKVLPHYSIEQGAIVDRRMVNRPTDVSLDDSAIQVMTDLNEITPFNIEPTASIDATNEKMIACGVRLLFVTDTENNLLGIVTAKDILGEKPVMYIKEHGGKREDIIVQDIMTPKNKLDVLSFNDVKRSTVGDIIETLKMLGRQHTLVEEIAENGSSIIRGIFSTTQISRQLGVTIDPAARAHTFADVEKVVLSV